MSQPQPERPTIMIVGAGLGGLALGAIFEHAGVPYEIFERSLVSNPVGSAIALSPSVMPMFDQLGLLDKLKAISKPHGLSKVYIEGQDLLGTMDFNTGFKEKFQNTGLIMARPELYKILLDQIPKNRIHYGKKLLSHQETGVGVLLRFSDNSEIEGNILVGADGANSSVRQSMYKQVARTGDLPASDKLPLKYSSISLVGQTSALDPERFALLKQACCDYDSVIAESKPYACVAFPTVQNTICWMVVEFLNKESSKIHDNFRTSEWGPEAAEMMAKDEAIRKIIIPSAAMVTMGELIDLTPKELMSKVMLEEKCFKTWTNGRTVLLGDACHKMSPAAGLGAVNAILDSTVLASYIESMQSNSLKEIEEAFAAYKNERFEGAKAAVDGSALTMRLITKGLIGNLVRKIVLNPPDWLWSIVANKAGQNRPQLAFLPRAEDKGTVKAPYQPSLHLPTSTRPKSRRSAVEV